MTRHFCLFVLAAFVCGVSGCAQNQTRIGEGTAIGGVLGAAAGEIVGHQNRHDLTGVLVGGALGAAAGAAVGAQIEKPASSPQKVYSAAQPVTMQQVVNWTKEGLSGDEIISRIKAAHSSYSLTADDLDYLKKQGVSQRVIETMQAFQ